MKPANEFLIKDEQVFSGALSCRGCGWSLLVRHLASLLGPDTVYVLPASCFSIISGPYPLSELKANVVHTLFAAAPATATGIRAALDRQGKKDTIVAVLAGDGGTFDIGLQALSGAAARGENILYIVNNNGAYMNTGIQTSTATPYGAITTTNPGVGYKKTWPKDLMGIIAAHNLPYAATCSLAFLEDFRKKVKRARDTEGFRLLMIDGPCPPGHKTEPGDSIFIARLAVETRLYPLFEIERQHYKLSYKPGSFVPVDECLKHQGRFKHLFKEENKMLLEDIQSHTDDNWNKLLAMEKLAHVLGEF
ncbi:MAG: pyruvate synthase subunit beta [Saprospirales bacterium]|nr:pyruvate synthase subunit beta [Saprospirales bacterium]MBK6903083.1 pyruvate synthase subunit beta [Saprospirales bacterium]MBK7334632.1 pyruvate synthase subunit beta [Saprospirales bacterium]